MRIRAFVAIALMAAGCNTRDIIFEAFPVPDIPGLETYCIPVRKGSEWNLDVKVTNSGSDTAIFKLALAAEPHFKASGYLFPGINYNGNPYGDNMPQGWEKDGHPWIFSYDRGSIPSCTISENKAHVFSLYVSDRDTCSLVSSSSMELLPDGSFRHLVYWPVTEAPLSYTDKRKFSPRYDTFITLAPGEEFHVEAFAVEGKPKWENYGFEKVFESAWKNLRHNTPAVRGIEEVVRLDRAYQRWGRRQDDEGYWYGGIIDDMVFRAGYYEGGKSPDGYTVEDYSSHPELNRWHTDEIEQSAHLAPGQYVRGPGRDLGFGGQAFQMARLSVQYGLSGGSAEDVDFGLKVLDSWINKRRGKSGLFRGYKPGSTTSDASRTGWAISELSRTVSVLKAHGIDADKYSSACEKLVGTVLDGVDAEGNPGSRWDCETGEVLSRGGDGGGDVLMGLARWWKLTGDRKVFEAVDKGLDYYYRKDIDYFRCSGGAMDCVSVDREGAHPFIAASMILYKGTGKKKYLEYAQKGTWYFLSWLYLQNPPYYPGTDLGKLGWKTAGATIVGAEHPALDEYACVLLPELFDLSRFTGESIWKEAAALIWRYSTQGFADEEHRIWHGLERPVGSKNEAVFMTRSSKYHVGESKRGSINDHLTAWGGTYRLASLLELSQEDIEYLGL